MRPPTKTLALTVVLIGIAASCAPRAIVINPITPEVKKARVVAQAATKAAERAQKSAGVVSVEAKLIASDVIDAQKELARIRNLPTTIPGTTDTLVELLEKLKVETSGHIITSGAVAVDTTDTVVEAKATEGNLVELEKTATVHDKQVDKLEATSAKNAVKADKWNALMRWKWAIIILGGLGLIVFTVLRYGTAIAAAYTRTLLLFRS